MRSWALVPQDCRPHCEPSASQQEALARAQPRWHRGSDACPRAVRTDRSAVSGARSVVFGRAARPETLPLCR